jgi:hypothetical protein
MMRSLALAGVLASSFACGGTPAARPCTDDRECTPQQRCEAGVCVER